MRPFPKVASTATNLCICLLATSLSGFAQHGVVERVRVLKTAADVVEIEIQTNQPIAPSTQEVSDPTRLVVDFPQATPGPQLRAIGVNHDKVKGVRVGLFRAQPPTTRVVFDLNAPTNYQLFPSGNTVIVKLGESVAPAASAAEPAAPVPPVEPPKPPVTVAFQNGLLTIHADKASLVDVLDAVHRQTGTQVSVPPGAGQEPVFADIGPAAPRDALNKLLNGSSYNFILVGSSSDPKVVDRVVLSSKGSNIVMEVGNHPANTASEPPSPPDQTFGASPPPAVTNAEDNQPPTDEMPADQAPPPPPDPQGDGQESPQGPPRS
jgi:hypothetical protein